mmetsp:Transcript_30129/g.55500  ORF Transcript_30129/g.55500 Transcript_30129/m.55500 type:complete len:242 (-) Transcript_30129:1981-2706(-)
MDPMPRVIRHAGAGKDCDQGGAGPAHVAKSDVSGPYGLGGSIGVRRNVVAAPRPPRNTRDGRGSDAGRRDHVGGSAPRLLRWLVLPREGSEARDGVWRYPDGNVLAQGIVASRKVLLRRFILRRGFDSYDIEICDWRGLVSTVEDLLWDGTRTSNVAAGCSHVAAVLHAEGLCPSMCQGMPCVCRNFWEVTDDTAGFHYSCNLAKSHPPNRHEISDNLEISLEKIRIAMLAVVAKSCLDLQ